MKILVLILSLPRKSPQGKAGAPRRAVPECRWQNRCHLAWSHAPWTLLFSMLSTELCFLEPRLCERHLCLNRDSGNQGEAQQQRVPRHGWPSMHEALGSVSSPAKISNR
jgi:hypothetical protein